MFPIVSYTGAVYVFVIQKSLKNTVTLDQERLCVHISSEWYNKMHFCPKKIYNGPWIVRICKGGSSVTVSGRKFCPCDLRNEWIIGSSESAHYAVTLADPWLQTAESWRRESLLQNLLRLLAPKNIFLPKSAFQIWRRLGQKMARRHLAFGKKPLFGNGDDARPLEKEIIIESFENFELLGFIPRFSR